MHIFGQLKAQSLKQLNVEGQGGEPLIPPDHMGGAHQVVIHGVGKVVGGDAVGLQKHMVHVVFRNGQLSLYQIVKFELVLNGAGGAEPQHPGVARGQLRLNILHAPITPEGVGAVVAGGFLVGFLLFPHGGELFLGAEAGVGLAFHNQLFGVDMVDFRPLTLAVGAVGAVVSINGGALIKVDVVVLQGRNEHLHRAGNLPLGIGILHPEEQNAVCPVGHPLGDHALDQVAQVYKACGRGSHTGDHGALRQIALGEPCFQLLRRGGHIGKQKLSKCLIIHKKYLFVIISRLEYSIAPFKNQCLSHQKIPCVNRQAMVK